MPRRSEKTYKPVTAVAIRRISTLLLDAERSPSQISAETGYPLAIVETLAEIHADRISLRRSFEHLKTLVVSLAVEIRQLRRIPVGQLDEAVLQVQVDRSLENSPQYQKLQASLDDLRLTLAKYFALQHPGQFRVPELLDSSGGSGGSAAARSR